MSPRIKPPFSILLACLILLVLPVLTAAGAEFTYTGYGANLAVTGSLHVVTLNGEKFILDAGSFQGGDGKDIPPITPEVISGVNAVIISHAHADHIGRLLKLVKLGYENKIYATTLTAEFLPIMLRMSARHGDFGIERFYYSSNSMRRARREGRSARAHSHNNCSSGETIFSPFFISASRDELENRSLYYCPICARMDVESVLRLVEPKELREPFKVAEEITAEFYHTPHMPGSAMILLRDTEGGGSILYTGDFGSGLSPFLPPQEKVSQADWVIVEGIHAPGDTHKVEERQHLRQFVAESIGAGKRVIIPAFVLDRTQQVLHELSVARRDGLLPENTAIKVFSPSANEISGIYAQTLREDRFAAYVSETYREQGPFDDIYQVPYPGDDEVAYGEVAIVSPGMADAGLAKRMVEKWVSDPRTAFVFVSYQAEGTLGRELTELSDSLVELVLKNGTSITGTVVNENVSMVLLDTGVGRRAISRSAIDSIQPGTPTINIDGEIYPVQAAIRRFHGMGGHGDVEQIHTFLADIEGLSAILIVHSDAPVAETLTEYYSTHFPDVEVLAPESLETYTFTK